MRRDFLQNKIIHNLFEITVFMKGVNGFLEILIGSFFFLKKETIQAIIFSPRYAFIHYIPISHVMRRLDTLSLSTQYFIGFYFLFYGIVNIFLVVSLLKGRLWAYPTSIVFHTLFIVYQTYRSILHSSIFLLSVSIFDAFLVMITWLEYKRLKNIRDNSLGAIP